MIKADDVRTGLRADEAIIFRRGYADKLLSDDRIRDNTAMSLGQPTSAVTISDRRYDGATNTYYTARPPRGSYNCIINGGSIMAMGMTNPLQGASLGSPIPAMSFGQPARR